MEDWIEEIIFKAWEHEEGFVGHIPAPEERASWEDITDDVKHHAKVYAKALRKEIESRLPKERIGTSTHGNCCTCQKCKHHHDECQCEYNQVICDIKHNLLGE